MQKSDQINEIGTALAKAQKVIKAANKDVENSFFKSSYADLEAVVEACKEALADNGIAYTQMPDFDATDMWLETVLIHSSGQWISGRYPIRPSKPDPQGYGSATTYARRYSLMAAAGIVATNEDDDGNAASGHSASPPAKRSEATKPIPSTGDPKAAATKWTNDAIEAIKGMKSAKEVADWEQSNSKFVTKLQGSSPEDYERLTDSIMAHYDRYNPVSA